MPSAGPGGSPCRPCAAWACRRSARAPGPPPRGGLFRLWALLATCLCFLERQPARAFHEGYGLEPEFAFEPPAGWEGVGGAVAAHGRYAVACGAGAGCLSARLGDDLAWAPAADVPPYSGSGHGDSPDAVHVYLLEACVPACLAGVAPAGEGGLAHDRVEAPGVGTGTRFGAALALAPRGGGGLALLVGAPGAGGGRGEVHVYHGGGDQPLTPVAVLSEAGAEGGGASAFGFGAALAVTEGSADAVAVGAPGTSLAPGAAFVYTRGLGSTPLDDPSTAPRVRVPAPAAAAGGGGAAPGPGERFGEAVAVAAVPGGAQLDIAVDFVLLVGSPGAGRAHLFALSATAGPAPAAALTDVLDYAPAGGAATGGGFVALTALHGVVFGTAGAGAGGAGLVGVSDVAARRLAPPGAFSPGGDYVADAAQYHGGYYRWSPADTAALGAGALPPDAGAHGAAGAAATVVAPGGGDPSGVCLSAPYAAAEAAGCVAVVVVGTPEAAGGAGGGTILRSGPGVLLGQASGSPTASPPPGGALGGASPPPAVALTWPPGPPGGGGLGAVNAALLAVVAVLAAALLLLAVVGGCFVRARMQKDAELVRQLHKELEGIRVEREYEQKHLNTDSDDDSSDSDELSVEREQADSVASLPKRKRSTAGLRKPRSARNSDDSDELEQLNVERSIHSVNHSLRILRNPSLSAKIPLPRGGECPLVPYEELKFVKELDHGSFKTVYEGTWGGNAVAITEVSIEMISREVAIMAQLSKHPNLVALFGLASNLAVEEKKEDDHVYLVMELVPKGNLIKFLHAHPELLSEERKVTIAQQICSGMAALAAEGIVHADLAARNVLVQSVEPCIVKVGDFGLSKSSKSALYYGEDNEKIPFRWSAPEVIEKGKWSEKSDVWAFGITLWEIYTHGNVPYGFGIPNSEVVKFVKSGGRPDRPPGCPMYMWEVMTSCWSLQEERRPNFLQLRDRLTRHKDAIKARVQPPTGPFSKKFMRQTSMEVARGGSRKKLIVAEGAAMTMSRKRLMLTAQASDLKNNPTILSRRSLLAGVRPTQVEPADAEIMARGVSRRALLGGGPARAPKAPSPVPKPRVGSHVSSSSFEDPSSDYDWSAGGAPRKVVDSRESDEGARSGKSRLSNASSSSYGQRTPQMTPASSLDQILPAGVGSTGDWMQGLPEGRLHTIGSGRRLSVDRNGELLELHAITSGRRLTVGRDGQVHDHPESSGEREAGMGAIHSVEEGENEGMESGELTSPIG